MNPNVRANEIVAMFTRRLSTGDDSEIAALSIEDIQSADEQLGERDVEKIYVEKESLDARGLTADDLVIPVEVLAADDLREIMAQQDMVISS